MPAHTHPRPGPAGRGGVENRLPWWAIALPSFAFAALLLLIVNPLGAHAAGGDLSLGHVLYSLFQHSVLHRTP
jgi:hypothetical protein